MEEEPVVFVARNLKLRFQNSNSNTTNPLTIKRFHLKGMENTYVQKIPISANQNTHN